MQFVSDVFCTNAFAVTIHLMLQCASRALSLVIWHAVTLHMCKQTLQFENLLTTLC